MHILTEGRLLSKYIYHEGYLQGDVDNHQNTAVLLLLHLFQLRLLCHQLWGEVMLLHCAWPQHSLPTHPLVGKSLSSSV